MKKLLFGVTVVATLVGGAQPVHSLSQYGEARPIRVRTYTCWFYEQTGKNTYQQRSLEIESRDVRRVLADCFTAYRTQVPRERIVRHA